MLDKLFCKYLTKKGRIAYLVGQILLFILWAFVVLGVLDYTMEEGRDLFFWGMVAIVFIWGGLCLVLWKEKGDKKEVENS